MLVKKIYQLRLLLLLAFVFQKSYSSAQAETDSLTKYSYLLFGFLHKQPEGAFVKFYPWQGTGFFVKKNDRLFLVSAKHVLTPCSYQKKRWDYYNYPDTFYIRIPVKKGSDSGWIPYQLITGRVKDTVTCFSYTYEDPDVFVIELSNMDSYKINYIDLEDYHLKVSDIAEVEFNGFFLDIPAGKLNFDNFTSQQSVRRKAVLFSDPDRPIIMTDSEEIKHDDVYDFELLREDTASLGGCSGSPVFFKQKNSGKWILGGLISGMPKGTKIELCVKSSMIKYKIDAIINKSSK